MITGRCLRAALLCIIAYLAQTSNSVYAMNDQKENLAGDSVLTVVEEPKDVTANHGDQVELRCEVFGAPVATIQWMRNGKLLRMSHRHRRHHHVNYLTSSHPLMVERESNGHERTFQMATTASKLRIPCVDDSDDGMYTCVVTNGRETATANATLRVQQKGRLSNSPAQIYMWTDSRMERPGVAVQLMCRATGVPTPTTMWYQKTDGEQRRIAIQGDDDRFTILPNGDLVIKKLPADAPLSIFKCEATNDYGTDTITSMLLEILDDTQDESKEAAEA